MARPVMNAQRADAIAKVFRVTHNAQGNPPDARVNNRGATTVFRAIEPAREFPGLPDFQHS